MYAAPILAALSVTILIVATPSFGQVTFTDLSAYCRAMSEASTPTLLGRTLNISRAQAEAAMQGMTDPASIRTVREVIAFAYSRPAGMSLEAMRLELRELCMTKKILAQ